MPLSQKNPAASPIEQEMEAVYCLYAGLAQWMDAETGMGGALLYVGEPDETGCRLLRAASIAGAASLAASADAAALRKAMHSGAVDFVVTSLDEALRILKNEIRKKQPVAVGVSLAQETVLKEMLERGVQPDLLAGALSQTTETQAFLARGARSVEPVTPAEGTRFQIMPIPADWKQPASAFDALLLERLPAEDFLNCRWVQLAPRYLPAESRRLRSVAGPVIGDR